MLSLIEVIILVCMFVGCTVGSVLFVRGSEVGSGVGLFIFVLSTLVGVWLFGMCRNKDIYNIYIWSFGAINYVLV